jgi:hypothetical protein
MRLQVEVHEDDGLVRVGQVQRLQVRQLLYMGEREGGEEESQWTRLEKGRWQSLG